MSRDQGENKGKAPSKRAGGMDRRAFLRKSGLGAGGAAIAGMLPFTGSPSIVAILFIAASFGHIYIGTIGADGTFEGMWRGSVDESWAKQHQDLWYEEKRGA